MKLFLQDSGDRSVGIQPNEMAIEINCIFSDGKEREFFREAAILFFKLTTYEFKLRCAIFDDECPLCLKLKTDCECDVVEAAEAKVQRDRCVD